MRLHDEQIKARNRIQQKAIRAVRPGPVSPTDDAQRSAKTAKQPSLGAIMPSRAVPATLCVQRLFTTQQRTGFQKQYVFVGEDVAQWPHTEGCPDLAGEDSRADLASFLQLPAQSLAISQWTRYRAITQGRAPTLPAC